MNFLLLFSYISGRLTYQIKKRIILKPANFILEKNILKFVYEFYLKEAAMGAVFAFFYINIIMGYDMFIMLSGRITI